MDHRCVASTHTHHQSTNNTTRTAHTENEKKVEKTNSNREENHRHQQHSHTHTHTTQNAHAEEAETWIVNDTECKQPGRYIIHNNTAKETLETLETLQATQALQQLKHDNWRVRCAALQKMYGLKSKVINPHFRTILPMLQDADWCVRLAALQMLGKFKSTETIFFLRDTQFNDIWSVLTCDTIKKSRAIERWTKARYFVKVYPYAIFWHEHVGESLCAPGGKWAQRDRIAFEEEFSSRCN
jgi:hypothetical protein